jgi:hypothetical protein
MSGKVLEANATIASTFSVNETPRHSQPPPVAHPDVVPSWVVGLCGVAAVASLLFSILLFLNR